MSMNRRTFALAALSPATLSIAKPSDRNLEKLWAEIPHWLELACVPGAVVALSQNGRAAGIHPLGVRSAGVAAAVDSETIFEAASLSKPVFASAVLRLAAEKGLDLDRPLDQIVPLASDPRAKRITARHVLRHSSGLQNWNRERCAGP